jgi:hypothetical protein
LENSFQNFLVTLAQRLRQQQKKALAKNTKNKKLPKPPGKFSPSCNGNKRARWLAREGKMISFLFLLSKAQP